MLLYQTEHRARREQLERIYRDEVERHEELKKSGYHSSFDVRSPWEHCFNLLLDDRDFWMDEFERKALVSMARKTSVKEDVGDDFAIESSGVQGLKRDASGRVRGSETPKVKAKAKASSTQKKDYSVQKDGLYSHNRAGSEICFKFNSGECSSKKGGKCPEQGHRSHQCAKCLKNDHGAFSCPLNQGGKAKGKGGKGKGKNKQGGD